MNIIFIRTTNIYSDSRATKEIKSLARAGHNLLVLGWDKHGNAENMCKKSFEGELGQVRFKFYMSHIEENIGLKNLNKLIGWWHWIIKQIKNQKKIDVIHCCDLDTGIIVKRISSNCKLVYDIFDYYVDSHSVPKFLVNLIEKNEIDLINKADITIICTEERMAQLSKANPKRVIVLYNSPNINTAELSNSTIYDYVYCGALKQRRLLNEVFDEYENNASQKFLIAGKGIFQKKAEVLSNRFDNFYYVGEISYDDVLKYESESMCLAAIYEPTLRNHKLCAPNKFYEALALGKPVIVCRGTGLDKVVEEHSVGVVIDYNVHEFYNALLYLKENPHLRKEMGERGQALYNRIYKWTLMEEILIHAYEDLGGEGK